MEHHLLRVRRMLVLTLLVIWFALALTFCLALARAAGRQLPQPNFANQSAGCVDYDFEESSQPAILRLRPTLASRLDLRPANQVPA